MDTVQLLCGKAIAFFTPFKVTGAGPVLRPSVCITLGSSTNPVGRKERRGRGREKGEEDGGRKMTEGESGGEGRAGRGGG